jgi:hypothetical protein
MKKLIVPIVIILLVLLGGGAYFMMSKSSKSVTPETATTANPTVATAAATQGTLKTLLTAGKPQTCTFDNNKGSSGTVYVANEKMAGDFTTTSGGNTVTAHMIIDSGYSYLWTGMTKMGIKISLAEAEKAETATNNQSVGLNDTVSYSCKDWSTDASKFTLPSDIKFSTFNIPGAAAPKATGTTGGSAVNPACSACDSLPAAAQGPCKTQLNCE